MGKLFESSNFIKTYLPTDKYIQIIYPNGDRFYNLNVCQRKKVVLVKNKLEIWSEGNLSKEVPFASEADARLGFDALNIALDSLSLNCQAEITNPPAAVFSIIPITYEGYKGLQVANNLGVLQYYDVTDTTNAFGLGTNYVYRVLSQKTNDWSPKGMCLNTRANVILNTWDNTFAYYQLGISNSTALNNSRITNVNNSNYLYAINNSTIIADACTYIQAQNNSTIDAQDSTGIRAYDGAILQLNNCHNCEFKGINPGILIQAYSDIIVDKKVSIGKEGTFTNVTSGTLALVAYKDVINQIFDGISGDYTSVTLATEFQEANAIFKVKFGTIDYNVTFKDALSNATLFIATPADSNTEITFRWDPILLTYIYQSTNVKLLRRIPITVVTNGQTSFSNVLIPTPYDPSTIKMYINGAPTLDFSVSGGISIIYNETEYSLETDDTVYVEYI